MEMDDPRRGRPKDRAPEEQVLLERVNAAAQHYRAAKEKTEAALALFTDLPLGHPDRNYARCLIAEQKALENYHAALKAYKELVVGRDAGNS
jgi:hypothetical protein